MSVMGGGDAFAFEDSNGFSGFLAFAGPATPHLLLVTDAGHDAVHVVDVTQRRRVGYVAAPGCVLGPRGVAARGPLVAVAAWKVPLSADHAVHLFAGGGTTWTQIRVIRPDSGPRDGQLEEPEGVRFSADGTEVAVADYGNNRVSLFRVADGSFVRHVAQQLDVPWDVEECADGWLVAAANAHMVAHRQEEIDDGVVSGKWNPRHHRLSGVAYQSREQDGAQFRPVILALVPGLGLLMREYYSERVEVFVFPDVIAMTAMSVCRVGWMVAVVRGMHCRRA